MSLTENNIIKGSRLISWQNDLVDEFLNLEPDERIVIKKCRQVGCSYTFAQILFYVAINRKKSTSVYITTTNSAARKFFTDMSVFCKKSSLVQLNATLLEMSFFNGSIIYFRSSESQLRGISCKNGGIMIADECAFLNSEVWTSILPFTTVSKANTLIASTPWTKRGMYYTFYQRALSGDPGYHLIDTRDYDLSYFISEDQKKEYKKILSPQAYRTEVEGEFMDSSSGLFGDYQSIFDEPEDKEPVYCGIDFSVSVGGDDTVLTGFNQNKQQCLLYMDNSTSDPVQRAERLADIINSYPTIKKVVCETNSMGSTFISILRRKLQRPNIIEEFTTTNNSKKDIIENLIACINKREITLLDDPKLDYEFGIFQFVELKNGNYTYAADTKVNQSHDDVVMATALAVKDFNSNQGQYLIRGQRHR